MKNIFCDFPFPRLHTNIKGMLISVDLGRFESSDEPSLKLFVFKAVEVTFMRNTFFQIECYDRQLRRSIMVNNLDQNSTEEEGEIPQSDNLKVIDKDHANNFFKSLEGGDLSSRDIKNPVFDGEGVLRSIEYLEAKFVFELHDTQRIENIDEIKIKLSFQSKISDLSQMKLEKNRVEIDALKQQNDILLRNVESIRAENVALQETINMLKRTVYDDRNFPVFRKGERSNLKSVILNQEKQREVCKAIGVGNFRDDIELIYRATENEFSVEECMNKIGTKKKMFFVIRTKKLRIFGGYTRLSWDRQTSPSKWKRDERAFIFGFHQDTNKIEVFPYGTEIIADRKKGGWGSVLCGDFAPSINSGDSDGIFWKGKTGTCILKGCFGTRRDEFKKDFLNDSTLFEADEWEVFHVL